MTSLHDADGLGVGDLHPKDPLPPFPTGFHGASVPCQQMTLLVEAILREHIMCNIFFEPCILDKFDKNIASADSKAAITWKFGQSPHTTQRNKMPLNNIFSASTTMPSIGRAH